MTGQDAVNVAKAFNERVGVTGIILTRVDGDARGGAALSMRAVTGEPIKFLGTGEKLDALEAFHPERVAGRILGMGDVVGAGREGRRDDRPGRGREARRQDEEGRVRPRRSRRSAAADAARWAAWAACWACCRASARSKEQLDEAKLDDKMICSARKRSSAR